MVHMASKHLHTCKPRVRGIPVVLLFSFLACIALSPFSHQLAGTVSSGVMNLKIQDFSGMNVDDHDNNVIVVFGGDSPLLDRQLFLDKFKGPEFTVRHVFNIIPAVSGVVKEASMHVIETARSVARVYQNTKREVPVSLPAMSGGLVPRASAGDAWWKQVLGLDASTANLSGQGVRVGVLDTGIGFNSSNGHVHHPDLAGRIVSSVNFASGLSSDDVYDAYGHGTHVAGIIAASGHSSSGLYAGIAPGVDIYNVKVLNNTGSGYEDDIIRGIEWCVEQGLDIINLSLGGGAPDPTDPESLALLNASSQGVLAVVSAGNDGPRLLTVASPGGASGVITVGAVNEELHVSSFSSRGPNLDRVFKPDVVAPGENIISTVAYNSFLEKYLHYFERVIPGSSGNQDGYIPLDGTSMAAPVVAAAAALVIERFSHSELPPALIIASLMDSAMDLGVDACIQGMGLVNVSGAISHLNQLQQATNFSTTLHVFPRNLPYAPFDLIHFPGDVQEMGLKVLHSGTQIVHVSIPAVLPHGIDVTVSNMTLELDDQSGVTAVHVRIVTSFDAGLGVYAFPISFMNASNHTIMNVTVSFTLKAPLLKVFIDSFHSMQDSYTRADRTVPITMDYHEIARNLSSMHVQLDAFMDGWTPGHVARDAKPPLLYPFLKTYDVVILAPAVVGYTPLEIAALTAFHEEGGHLVVLGTRHQWMSTAGGNALLEALGVGVRFEPRNFEMITDNGWDHHVQDIIVRNLNTTSPLSAGISQVLWSVGCHLAVNDGRVSVVATSGAGDPLVAFLPSSGSHGSVLVAGSNAIIPHDPAHRGNMPFIHNVINEYLEYVSITLNVHQPDVILINQASLSVHLQAVNKSTRLPVNVSAMEDVSCFIFDDDGIVQSVTMAASGSTWIGNASIDVSTLSNATSAYKITVNYTIDGTLHTVQLGFHKFQVLSIPYLDLAVAETTLFRGMTQGFTFNTTVVEGLLLVDGSGNDPLGRLGPVHSRMTSTGDAGLPLPIAMHEPAGLRVALLEINSTDGFFPFHGPQRVSFTVRNQEPAFNTSSSSFQGRPFDQIDLGDGRVAVIPVQTERPLVLSIFGSDNETTTPNMSVFVLFYPTYTVDNTVGLIPYGRNLIKTALPFDPSSGGFAGTIQIPRGVSFLVAGRTVTKQFNSEGAYSGALVVVLRDADGGYEYFPILLQITSPFSIDLLTIILISIVGVSVVLGLLVFFSKNKQWQGKQPKIPREPAMEPDRAYEFSFCPYCGEYIRSRVKDCPACGKEIFF